MGVAETPEPTYWRNRRLSPAELLVHDVRIEAWRPESETSQVTPILEVKEISSSTVLPNLGDRDHLRESWEIDSLHPSLKSMSTTRQEQLQLSGLISEYGWMNCLRSWRAQESTDDLGNSCKCRWIHISSLDAQYTEGSLLALSDLTYNPTRIVQAFRQLQDTVYQIERFSKHGRYFTPFCQPLLDGSRSPMLLSIPFLD